MSGSPSREDVECKCGAGKGLRPRGAETGAQRSRQGSGWSGLWLETVEEESFLEKGNITVGSGTGFRLFLGIVLTGYVYTLFLCLPDHIPGQSKNRRVCRQ